MSIFLSVVAYIAVGIFTAAVFRKRFNRDFADFPVEFLVSAIWPFCVAGMLGAMVGEFLVSRNRK